MKSFELFVGAGGLALGISDAGFKHEGVIEWDSNACDTIRLNQERGIDPVLWLLTVSGITTPVVDDIRGSVLDGIPCIREGYGLTN